VELTLQAGMSVARVAQAEGVNSHQVFQWRRAYRQGMLGEAGAGCTALLPVVVSKPGNEKQTGPSGSIHIELPGRATITAESGADVHLLRAVLTTLANIDRLPGNPEEALRQ
jgi:transposase